MDLAVYRERVQTIDDQRQALTEQLERLQSQESHARDAHRRREQLQSIAAHGLAGIPRPQLKALLRQVVERVVVLDHEVARVQLA